MNCIKRQAECEVLPSFLGVDEIAELWADGTTFSEESYVKLLKEDIEDGKLACMTIGQWIALSDQRRKLLSRTRLPKITPPPKETTLPCCFCFGVSAYATRENDLVPQDRIGGHLGDTSGMSGDEKEMVARLYMVNRTEFKKWLEKNEEWPLPEKCLLARWWGSAEGDEEANVLQAAATKQQEKAIQVLINRVVQANPEARPVYIWNKLKEYDTDGIIEEQEPERIETIAGNEDAYIRYNHPKRGTAYAPIKLQSIFFPYFFSDNPYFPLLSYCAVISSAFFSFADSSG
jgi:hypothetical protein